MNCSSQKKKTHRKSSRPDKRKSPRILTLSWGGILGDFFSLCSSDPALRANLHTAVGLHLLSGIERTQEFTAPAYESTEEEASPLMLRYQEAITTTDTYHETKRSFAWIGEIEDENLLAALEQLSDSDLELITLYAYEEYDTVEISKLFGTTKQNISKKIRRITNFIKNFQIRVV